MTTAVHNATLCFVSFLKRYMTTISSVITTFVVVVVIMPGTFSNFCVLICRSTNKLDLMSSGCTVFNQCKRIWHMEECGECRSKHLRQPCFNYVHRRSKDWASTDEFKTIIPAGLESFEKKAKNVKAKSNPVLLMIHGKLFRGKKNKNNSSHWNYPSFLIMCKWYHQAQVFVHLKDDFVHQ